jgi:hypothetical protein
MPQSTNVTAQQMRNIPEQAAEAAAVSHDHETHPTPHEQSTNAKEQSHERPTGDGQHTVHNQALQHGHAESIAVKKQTEGK